MCSFAGVLSFRVGLECLHCLWLLAWSYVSRFSSILSVYFVVYRMFLPI